MSRPQIEEILGYGVWSDDVHSCVEDIVGWVESGNGPRWLACLNPHSCVVAERAADFANALRRATWLIPDGTGIVLASWMCGGKVRIRVTGSDIFFGVMEALERRGGGRVFFLGSTDETLRILREKTRIDYPRVEVVGTHSPPFKPEYSEDELAEMVRAVNAARPQVLWVGMTAPKQELWIDRVVARLDVKFVAAIGAVFDFYSGRVTRSGGAFQRLGLEWLPRLVREPRRLWRRTLISAPAFMWRVVQDRIWK
jgi:N-acetylglucosaminyldiphosphoundecaprenol N-acetyl-beta-D-mannosaminyltransferase